MLDRLWVDLRFHRVPESRAQDAYRKACLGYLERFVAFAFADGVIEQHELTGFLSAVAVLNVHDRAVDQMRARMERGRVLAVCIEGDLPRIQNPSLHLEVGEIVHLEPRPTPSRLVASSKKLRFISSGAGGSDTPWAKVHAVTPGRGGVEISTSTRATGTYLLHDPEYAAAVLAGTLKVPIGSRTGYSRPSREIKVPTRFASSSNGQKVPLSWRSITAVQ